MPIFKSASDLDMYYIEDDYTDPWKKSECVLMLHGACESSAAWYGGKPPNLPVFRSTTMS